ncbi:hypothetical protein NLM59_10080 [Weeksellaceae bacterium KMM 9724]|uniref:hypothetical protein n=1 Tax=Profundicola chukchiensis TaxID=2961959 RepID=UPI00243F1C1A|nr:hypothetical protein [Profundicola chukchiensis]MDG4951275.1 hypothetical protein [Profundicola chukchiensis]
MKNILLLLTIFLLSIVDGQESIDTLTYAKTEIKVPENCIAKSQYEILDCNGFSAQWLYLNQEMIDLGFHKQLFSQLEGQINYSKKAEIRFKSQSQDFNGFRYGLKDGFTRIYGIGKVDGQWLILNLGFENSADKNSDLSAFERNFIELE